MIVVILRHDIDDFLTKYMEKISDPDIVSPFDYEQEKRLFLKTFTVLSSTLGDRAFAFANKTRNDLARGFSVYHFEALTIGLQECLDCIALDNQEMMKRLTNMFMEIKLDPVFIRMTTGGGKNSPGPLKERIRFVEERVKAIV